VLFQREARDSEGGSFVETRFSGAGTPVDRRDFLKSATGVITGVLAVGSPLALIAPSRVWAADLKVFSSAEGAALMAMARTIAPHDKLEDAAYAIVVQSVDADASADPATRKMLTEGIATLGASFASAPEAARVAQLKKVEQSPFFQTVRVKTLSVLYATEMAYRYFGYEGEAFSKGGYLFRGFNDLRWLPEVPLADSGPVPAKA
jgi:predicted aconitase